MLGRRTIPACLLALAAPACACPLALGAPFKVVPGRYEARPQFTVVYTGSGRWQTTYHSEPPNPGGMHDTDDAHDSSRQSWSLRFPRLLGLRSAAFPSATGQERASGQIDHTHLDGLYSDDDASASCSVSSVTPRGARLSATLRASFRGAPGRLFITVGDPDADALTLLARSCPGQGDSIDGLLDNYFGPGFSFAPTWGPSRWFTAAPITVPGAVLQRARRIVVRLGDVPAGTPSAGCSVLHPSYEHCTTGGSWGGVLTLRRRAPSAG
jgi:hypothetical protein